MIRLLRKLFALPFIWLGQLAVMLQQPGPAIPLLRMAWRISGEGRIGLTALVQVFRVYGREASSAEARQWMQKHPRTEVAAWAGLLALDSKRLEDARQMLDRGLQLGRDREGMLDMLQLRVMLVEGDTGRLRQFCRDMEARRDATPQVSKTILSFLAMDALEGGRFDEARRRASFLLQVEDSAAAHVVLWALATRDGREDVAARHLRRASACDRLECLSQQAVAADAIGDTEQSRRCLAELHETRPEFAEGMEERLARRREQQA
ncbi:MAG TPA: hypothetical protein VFJ30_06805 [Phycisphaerae bacterium]|nr:hypothetical protein [Phycisphaerae bacterium]